MNFKGILITVWIWFPALVSSYHTRDDPVLVCESPECNERAKLLNESLNTSADPCKDFYLYVCGGWESSHSLLSGSGSYDVYDEIGKDIPQKLTDILENRTLVESNQTIFDKISIMYNKCLALPDAPDVLIGVLNASGFNAWPIFTEQNIFNSSNCTDLLRYMNISAIFSVDLTRSPYRRLANPYQIVINPMGVKEKMNDESRITVLINNTIMLLNPGIESSKLENLTRQLMEFGKNIPISYLLRKEFRKVNITLSDEYRLKVAHVYYKKLSTFLETANPNTLYNFAGLFTLLPYMEYVNMSTQEPISNDLTQSATKGRSRSECLALLDETTPELLDYLYVTNDPNHVTITREVEDIARRVKQALNETFQNSSWIDNATREALQKELNEVPLGIGYPKELLNMSVLETFYKYVPFFALDISFTEAMYYFREDLYKMTLRKFWYPEESDWRWDRSVRDVRHPFHDSFGIKIEIPYPVFVSPFFQRGVPRSLNYGGIGGTIARELGSTFSIDGMQTIRKNYKNLVTKEFSEFFKNKSSCFEQQYTTANKEMLRNFSRKPLFWKQTLDEDLADNTGLQTAFNAYKKTLEEECDWQDTRLAGLQNFSGMQLFLISSARTMCKIANEEALIREIESPKYSRSPAQHRVNEAMKNLKEFAEAFKCSLDSPMYPNKTCSLW